MIITVQNKTKLAFVVTAIPLVSLAFIVINVFSLDYSAFPIAIMFSHFWLISLALGLLISIYLIFVKVLGKKLERAIYYLILLFLFVVFAMQTVKLGFIHRDAFLIGDFVFIVVVLISVILTIILPYLVTLKLLSKEPQKVASMLVSYFLIFILTLLPIQYHISFDKDVWGSVDFNYYPREHMVKDLIENHGLVGMPVDELEELLGEVELGEEPPYILHYILLEHYEWFGFDVEFRKFLVLELDSEKVVSAEIIKTN